MYENKCLVMRNPNERKEYTFVHCRVFGDITVEDEHEVCKRMTVDEANKFYLELKAKGFVVTYTDEEDY